MFDMLLEKKRHRQNPNETKNAQNAKSAILDSL